jgi:hypothetical protein
MPAPSAAWTDHPVVAYSWTMPDGRPDTSAQLERVHALCRAHGFSVASELRAERFPELTELVRRVIRHEARHLVLTREALANLEQRFPDAWRGVRARIEALGTTLVTA